MRRSGAAGLAVLQWQAMATKTEAWRSVDGSLHETELSAERADAEYELQRAARKLAIAIKPAYGDEDQLARDLLEYSELVMDMGDAFKRRTRFS